MPTKIATIEVSESIPAISLEGKYNSIRILVCQNHRPLGWISFYGLNSDHVLTPEEIKNALIGKLEWKLIANHILEDQISWVNSKEVNYSVPISIVVCTRNRTKELTVCIQSLMQLKYDHYEIIVVDNAPDNDETFNLVSSFPIKYIREEKPGLDWARNRGVNEAKYSIIAFTDDDVHVDKYWLKVIAEIFSDQDVMGASGLVAPAELETFPQHVFEVNYGGMGHGFNRRVLNKENKNSQQLLWISNVCVGANMAFRKEVFTKIGLFDTALDVGTPSNGGGDIELCHRLVAKNFVFVYEPSMLVWHYHRKDRKALLKQIFNNGRSFGCFLINCFRHKTVSRTYIIRFFFLEWMIKWNMRNLLSRKSKVPKFLVMAELKGIMSSPYAYYKTQAWDKKMKSNLK